MNRFTHSLRLTTLLLSLALTAFAGTAFAIDPDDPDFPDPPHSGLPDLEVLSVTLSPANPTAGEAVDIRVKIFNGGTGSTPSGVAVGTGVQVDGSHTGSFFVRNSSGSAISLGAGNSYTGTASPAWTATAGSHQICAYADDINRFAELDENNNSKCISVTVSSEPSYPDVTVDSVSLYPWDPEHGDYVTISVRIKNISSTATPSGVDVGVGVQVDGSHVGSFFVRNSSQQAVPLGGNQSYTGSVSWTATYGSHQICAYADDIDRFAESNENNNSKCTTVYVDFGGPGLPGDKSADAPGVDAALYRATLDLSGDTLPLLSLSNPSESAVEIHVVATGDSDALRRYRIRLEARGSSTLSLESADGFTRVAMSSRDMFSAQLQGDADQPEREIAVSDRQLGSKAICKPLFQCNGDWTLTCTNCSYGPFTHEGFVRSYGRVYWNDNRPLNPHVSWESENSEGLGASWTASGGCPVSVTNDLGHTYTVTIDELPEEPCDLDR